jgi:hypothetical protein
MLERLNFFCLSDNKDIKNTLKRVRMLGGSTRDVEGARKVNVSNQ